MKRALLILAAVVAVALPILVIAQSRTPRDSSATKPALRERRAREYNQKTRIAAELARVARDRSKADADRARQRALREWRRSDEGFGADELAAVAPAIEEAMAGVEPALAHAREALENIDWGVVNEAMQDASENLALARLAPMPPLPPISGLPPFPALAPFPDFPPLPDMPPMPALAPMLDISLGHGKSFGGGWSFGHREYTKNLSADEQIRMQALAALLDNDEKTALPEIQTVARQSENWAMRAYAVSLLANAESDDTIPLLEEVLNKDTDQRVRKAAVRALSRRDEPAAREALKRLLMK